MRCLLTKFKFLKCLSGPNIHSKVVKQPSYITCTSERKSQMKKSKIIFDFDFLMSHVRRLHLLLNKRFYTYIWVLLTTFLLFSYLLIVSYLALRIQFLSVFWGVSTRVCNQMLKWSLYWDIFRNFMHFYLSLLQKST